VKIGPIRFSGLAYGGDALLRLRHVLSLVGALSLTARAEFGIEVNEYGSPSITESRPAGALTLPESTHEQTGARIGMGLVQSGVGSTDIADFSRLSSEGRSILDDCADLKCVATPSGVVVTGVSAAAGCAGVTSIRFPSGVTAIENFAFAECRGLTNVVFPEGLISIGGWAFYRCSGLKGVTIPESVTTIWDSAFQECTDMTRLNLGKSVSSIGARAFAGCDRLTSVIFPKSVRFLYDYAFIESYGLKEAYFEGDPPSFERAPFDAGVPTVSNLVIYYPRGNVLWGSTFAGVPAFPWSSPERAAFQPGLQFGLGAIDFGFVFSWPTNQEAVVEFKSDFGNPEWTPVSTRVSIDGSITVSDPGWTNASARFYRIRGR